MNPVFARLTLFSLLIFYSFAQAQKEYKLLPDKSELHWKGSSQMGGVHQGTLQLTSGNLIITSTQEITKGDFVIDMNAMDTDLHQKEKSDELEDYLKSDDFFSVDKYPKAFFSIIKATPVAGFLQPYEYTVTGFLGIKGITNQISFLATITIVNDSVSAHAKLVIDRTKWGVVHRSKTIFADLKDGVINDDIEITLNLSFKAAK